MKNFTKLIKLSKLKFINLSAFHVDCSYKPMSVKLSAIHTTLACMRLSVAMELSKTMTMTIGLYYARIHSPVCPCLLWPRSPMSATAELLSLRLQKRLKLHVNVVPCAVHACNVHYTNAQSRIGLGGRDDFPCFPVIEMLSCRLSPIQTISQRPRQETGTICTGPQSAAFTCSYRPYYS